MSGAGSGFAGTTNGSFFEAPAWVDKSKPPGASKQTAPRWSAWLLNVLKTRHFFFSPNFVWFSIALFVYVAFPYDFQAAQSFRTGWIWKRLAINFAVVYAYVGFWDVTLYGLQWGKRKFNPVRWPKASEFFHNLWYMNLGILQWTFWEAFFIYAYANGRLPYIKDSDVFTSVGNITWTALLILLVPIWRGFHFYFAHRFIHIRPMYRFVHSLHHRNTDIEPFAGLCMHPVEHMYYFSCIAPSLYIYASPIIFAWNGWHLLLSPAASHSGWEDHMQSDQFHYLHHARFECNYGSASIPLDNMFGTFVDVLAQPTDTKEDPEVTFAHAKTEGFQKTLADTVTTNASADTVTTNASADTVTTNTSADTVTTNASAVAQSSPCRSADKDSQQMPIESNERKSDASDALPDTEKKAVKYTSDEVAKHTSKDDCWIILHGRVIDVTDWLPKHPGGQRVLLNFAGKDATETFNTIHQPGVVEKYVSGAILGMLEGAEPKLKRRYSAPPKLETFDDNGLGTPLLDDEAASEDEESEEQSILSNLLPSRDYSVYMSFAVATFGVLWFAITEQYSVHQFPYCVAALVAVGPVAFATALCPIFGEKLDLRWPFQHESLFGKLGLHLLVGVLVGVLPVYHTLTMVMAEPAFCQLWDHTHQSLCVSMATNDAVSTAIGR
jgi:sterol desaturase/sphingolipid hydroxylase (fatty acid hydroxylase superfamily)